MLLSIQRYAFLLATALGLVATLHAPAMAQDLVADSPVTVLWTERRPFQYTDDDGRAKGLLVDIGEKIFAQAGVPHTWEPAPANRVINLLKFNDKPLCAVGWYKSEEREAIAQFTQAIYQDKPLRGVFRASAEVPKGIGAKEALADPKSRVLLKLGFAYGPFLDELIARKNPTQVERVSVEVPNLLRMVQANRADLVLLSQEEIDYYEKSDTNFRKEFKVVVFGDLPETDQRFIMCSKRVPAKYMMQLNTAIAATIRLK